MMGTIPDADAEIIGIAIADCVDVKETSPVRFGHAIYDALRKAGYLIIVNAPPAATCPICLMRQDQVVAVCGSCSISTCPMRGR